MQRAMMLIEQGRFDLALPELKRYVSESPEDGYALTMLSLCYSNLDQDVEALRVAENAVGLQPESDLAHYAMAKAHLSLSNLKAAQKAISEAILLDPEDSSYHALQAVIYVSKSEWQKALGAAQEGLAIDPEDEECNNLKAMALRKSGKENAEEETLSETLRRNPEDAFTHANLGWSFLEKGERDKALNHFHEALRLEPTLEWARDGVMMAMKSKNIFYSLILKYFFFMAKKKATYQQGLLGGLFIGYLVLLSLSSTYPILDYFVYAYIFFALSTWFSDPFFTAIMYSSRDGRIILQERERKESIAFICLGSIALTMFIWKLFDNSLLIQNSMYLSIALLIVICAISMYSKNDTIHVGILYLVVLGVLGGSSLLLLYLENSWNEFFRTVAFYSFLGFQFFLQSE